jgi:hypothetical protein
LSGIAGELVDLVANRVIEPETSDKHWASLNLPSVPFKQGELHV